MTNSFFNLLKTEHNEVKELLNTIHKKGDPDGDLMQELSKKLQVHMDGEEKYFYPAMKEFPELSEMIIEALEEHEAAERILRKLRWLPSDAVGFHGRLKVLKEFIEHHVNEEEKEIFPACEKVVSKEQFSEIEQNYLEYSEKKMGSVFPW